MDVSIIIVNYNTKKMTEECIDSIFQHTKNIKFEIIVVDNASTDGSKEYFEQDKRIKYIYSTTNLGFGNANNIGYKQASGKYLFLLNSDTLLLNNAIDLFFNIAESEKNKSIGCWGTMLYDSNQNVTASYGKFISIWIDLFFMLFYVPIKKLTNKTLPYFENEYNYKINNNNIVDFITGADIFLKKEVADKYGLFDPNYFLYCEETDMQKRYSQHKIYSKIVTGPQIIHFHGGSQKKGINYKMNLIKLKSKIYYFKKWCNPISVYTYLTLVTLIKLPFFIFSKQPSDYKKEYLKTLWR